MRFRDYILKEMGGMTSTATLGKGNPFGFSDLANPANMDTGGHISAIVGRGNQIIQPVLYSLRRFAHFATNVYSWQQNNLAGQMTQTNPNDPWEARTNQYLGAIDPITNFSMITSIPEEALKLPGGGAITPDEMHLAQQGFQIDDPLSGRPIKFSPFLQVQGKDASGGTLYSLDTKALKEQIDQLEMIQYRSSTMGRMADSGLAKFWQQASNPGLMKPQVGVNPNQY